MGSSPEFLVGFSTTDSEEEAIKISNALVGEGLAACVNIVPNLRSIYKWQEKICDEKEFLMIIKTVMSKKEILKKRLKELHHYDVPELIFIPIADGLPDYLSWLSGKFTQFR